MKAICKKVGKKAVLVDVPDECKRLSKLAEYTGAELVTQKIASDLVAVYEQGAADDQPSCRLGDVTIYGDFMLLGAAGSWLKDVSLEIYTNHSMLPGLWAKVRARK